MNDMAHPLWLDPWPLVLASQSASRAAMLRAAGIPIEIVPSDVDERAVQGGGGAGRDPAALARMLAEAKAQAVSASRPRRLVLGSDQVLQVGGEILHKPRGLAEARRQLLRLRDRDHTLHSAAAFVVDGKVVESFVSRADLTGRAFTEEFLDRYLGLTADQATSSVGSYRLEDVGIHLFDRVEGDHFTILGMPLLAVLDALRRRGVVLS
jgi:septum formation protein